MTDAYGKFKAVYAYDNEPVDDMCCLEPPLAAPEIQGKSAEWVDQWLIVTGFGRYRPTFRKHGITGDRIFSMTLDGLKAIGVLDKGDAQSILGNIYQLRGSSQHTGRQEIPDLPYTHHGALCFGQQPSITKWLTTPTNPGLAVGLDRHHISHTIPHMADHRVLARIRNETGDRYGWYQRNQPHQLI